MESIIKDGFQRVVDHVFNNWTALQLAIEHDMGGFNSQQTAREAAEYMCTFCISQHNVGVQDITEALEDIMDEEFETICEDNSPNEVAQVLYQFLVLLRSGNMEQFELEVNKLPCASRTTRSVPRPVTVEEDKSEDESDSDTMEVDQGWTVIKNRRKK